MRRLQNTLSTYYAPAILAKRSIFIRYNCRDMKFAHHYHTRVRRQPYPAKSMGLRALDVVVYIAGILGPLATLPQVLQIYTTHNASGISLATWSLYALFDLPWIIYAIVHREPPL